jgi:hypothetical protein
MISTLQITRTCWVYSIFTSCILATDFNTGTITVSLNYTLQISQYYITQSLLSIAGLSTLNWTALNNSDALIPLLPSSYPGRLVSWNSTDSNNLLVIFIAPGHGLHRKHSSSTVAHTRLWGNAPTQLFHSNGHTLHHYCHSNLDQNFYSVKENTAYSSHGKC